MTVFTIKIIAMVSMIIDHIGVIFFPKILLFRLIGRIAFPLFAWLIANGARHTTDKTRYLMRLFLFAALAEIPYLLAIREVYPRFFDFNALFCLTLGLAAILVIKESESIVLSVIGVILCSLVAMQLNVDYGYIGVLSVVCFYLFFYDFKKMLFAQAILFIIPFWLPIGSQMIQHAALSQNFVNMAEPIGLLSLFVIYRYNGKIGRNLQYFFYAFYPLHLFILYLLKRVFT